MNPGADDDLIRYFGAERNLTLQGVAVFDDKHKTFTQLIDHGLVRDQQAAVSGSITPFSVTADSSKRPN